MGEAVTGLRTTIKVLAVWLSLGLFVVCLTVLFMGMRATLGVGGFCAQGGAYVIETPCPKGIGWMMPVSIWLGLFATATYGFAGRGLPGPKWVALAWPALFLSLGWNFWEFGLRPPGDQGVVVGLIVCGVAFGAMGLLPLIALLASRKGRHWIFWSDAAATTGRATYRDTRDTLKSIDWRSLGATGDSAGSTARSDGVAGDRDDGIDDHGGDVVDRLERLTVLYQRGDITAEEFTEGKRLLLGGRT